MKIIYITFLISFSLISCTDELEIKNYEDSIYFPPTENTLWETVSVKDLNWNENQVSLLLDFLEEKNTKSFIILYNGKIVIEKYFGSHTTETPWYWASAGKTLTTATVGIAIDKGLININNPVSNYLGTNWTSAPIDKENLITSWHLLTMTSGLDDSLNDSTDPNNLIYKADAGTRWAYHNVYVKLQEIIEKVSNQSFNSFFNTNLRDKIGMTGLWAKLDDLSVYFSNSRSMARFGLLALNKGKWESEQIISESYFNESVNTSQNINKSYGYLWWLNGKSSYRLPQTQFEFIGNLIPNAPLDLYAALGKNDQKIYISPSKKLVIIRMGESAEGTNFALSNFDNELWEKINLVIENN
jgi:CubicO group peptidase (beta-lactamase class C family)